MEKVYFVGEYGYGFRQVLSFLENYNQKLEIITWLPLCKIIKLLWPNKFITLGCENYISDVNENNRVCHRSKNTIIYNELEKLGYINICLLDKYKKYLYIENAGWFRTDKKYTLKQKILYGKQHLEKPYVSIFPRKRTHCVEKNNITQDHIDWLKEEYPDKEIVGHGLPEERMQFDIRYCEDIYEQINVFNNSEVFLCPSSGLAELALLCGCNLILTGEYPGVEGGNVHNCTICFFGEKICLH